MVEYDAPHIANYFSWVAVFESLCNSSAAQQVGHTYLVIPHLQHSLDAVVGQDESL